MAARVSSPRFVGRTREMARLEAALVDARAGRGGCFLVGGDAGVGKTRLVHEFTARAGDAQVLLGGCIPLGEGGLPFAPVVEVLRSLTRDVGGERVVELAGPSAAELARLLPELGPGQGAVAASSADDVYSQSRLFEVVLGLLERLAADRPVLLVVEDLHWADQSTRDLLTFLFHGLPRCPIVAIATYRTDELHRRHPLRPFLAEADRSGRIERLELAPFDREELAQQLTGILDTPPTPDLVDVILDRSEGNAFFAEELLAAGADVQGLPQTLRDILMARMETLPEAAQAVLRVAAAAGRQVPHRLLAAVAGLPERDLADALRDAVAHQVVVIDGQDGAYAFRHALVQEALYDDLLPGERSDLHAAYARTLTDQPELAGPDGVALASQLAHHWYAALELDEALVAAVAAGLAADEVYAFAESQQHFERALEVWDRAPAAHGRIPLDHVAVLQRAADAAYLTSHFDRAHELIRLAIVEQDADADPARAGYLHVRSGRYLWADGRNRPALEQYEHALAITPADPPTSERAMVLAAHGQALMLMSQFRESETRCQEAIAVARQVGNRAIEGHARNTLGTSLASMGRFDEGIDLLYQALAIGFEMGDFDDLARAHANLAESLEQAGRLEEAVQVALDGLAIVRPAGMMRSFGCYLVANAASAGFRLGRWDDADRVTTEALTYAIRSMGAIRLHTSRLALHTARGAFDEAREDLALATRMSADIHDVQHRGLLNLRHAQLALEEARFDEAWEAVDLALTLAHDSEDEWYLGAMLSVAVRTEVESGRGERVPPLLDEAARIRRSTEGRTSPALLADLATAEAEATRAPARPSDPEAWAGAVAAWDQAGEPYPAAYACFRQAEAALDAGDRGAAVAPLRRAHELLRPLGARPRLDAVEALARRARITLTGHGAGSEAPPDDPFGLTDRELEVLVLVADGRSNGQIAEALYISAKTASVHVSNILRKIGVSGRGEAAAVARRSGLV